MTGLRFIINVLTHIDAVATTPAIGYPHALYKAIKKNSILELFSNKTLAAFQFRILPHPCAFIQSIETCMCGASQLQLFILGTLLYRLADTTCCCAQYITISMCVSLILLISLISNSISPNRFPTPHIIPSLFSFFCATHS